VLQPLFEDYEVFSRVGEATDIVRKEMYDFEDKGGRRMVLRPEGTAAVVRAFVQHRPTTPWKAWYVGPNFRYERPQALVLCGASLSAPRPQAARRTWRMRCG
jgi:histidyl-tRNA synthetase